MKPYLVECHRCGFTAEFDHLDEANTARAKHINSTHQDVDVSHPDSVEVVSVTKRDEPQPVVADEAAPESETPGESKAEG